MSAFASRVPHLFHVTDRAALEGIARDGLLPAALLVARHGADARAHLQENRAAWVPLAPGVALRRQGMRDHSLAPRLDPSITCAGWRMFINGLVFFYPSLSAAERMVRTEPTRDQLILRFRTAALEAVGVPLLTCRFNNGYIDRAPRATARRRHFGDYRPAAAWAGEPVKEVASSILVPASVDFDVAGAP